MSARSRKSVNSEDLGLSLTGSQYGSLAAAKRPGSAKSSGQRPPVIASSKSTTNLSNGNHRDKNSTNNTATRNRHTRTGSHGSLPRNGDGDGPAQQSARTDVSAMSSAREDFLALFESSAKPKIGKPKAQQRASPSRRGGMNHQFLANRSRGKESPVPGKDRLAQQFQHSIFQPLSARTSSTIDDDYENQNFLSLNDPARTSPHHDSLLHPNDNNQTSNNNHNTVLQTASSDILNSQRVVPPGSQVDRRAASPRLNSITNNMTSQGKSPGVKTALIDIQNSYQNIKHKTPVNQVRKLSSSLAAETNLSDDYMKTVHMAASKIQRWYRRIHIRSKAGSAAIKRLLDSKRLEKEAQMKSEEFQLTKEQQVLEDRKRIREQRARQARQDAIQELHRKREEKRLENKKVAEEEVAFLQASGKISKQPAKSNVRKKVLTKTRPRNQARNTTDSDSDCHSSDSEHGRVRPAPKGNNAHPSASIDEFFQDNIGRAVPHHEVSVKEGVSPNNVTVKSEEEGECATATPSLVPTKTTFNDLMDTLRLLEEEEKFPNAANKNKPKHDDIENDELASENARYLSAGELQKLNPSKQNLTKSGLLSEEKLRSIMSFLDEVETADRLSQIDQDVSKVNEALDKPALVVPSAEEIQQLESVTAVASEVTNTVLSQRLQLEEKNRSVTMLQKALNQQRELTVRHARETEKEMNKRLQLQKDDYEETIKRHLSFIDQLIDDKKALSEKCEQLVKELKLVDKKYSDKIRILEENHDIEMKKVKDVQAAAEKLRREKWIDEKTKRIKEMTVKGLEPEIQRLIAKHKGEIKKLKSIHEAELLESDERAGQRYIKLTEELRDQLAKEKESACARERELARQTYEKQMTQEEEAYQQQRRRMFSEVQEEKERVAQQAARQRAELDKLQRHLEDNQSKTAEAQRREYEKAREEQERRHAAELRQVRDQLSVEKEAWEENLMKKQETWTLQKERELKEQVRRERDKEIEMVIGRLEEDNLSSREECERVAENKVRRLRDKYESEIKELERSERNIMERYNDLKGKFAEIEGENERAKALMKQKDIEVDDIKKLSEKLNKERERVADIIRQEFADRLVATDEENKRLKNEMSEQKARQRLEVERVKADIEVVQRAKEEEMEEVHKRVKQAIVKKEDVVKQLREQYQAAVKRADHLEGLLEQQRKQLLARK